MRRTHGLSTRLVVAIGLLAALHLTVFIVLLATLHDLGAADHQARISARVAMASTDSRIALARGDVAGMRGGAAELFSSGAEANVSEAPKLALALQRQAEAARAPHREAPGARALDEQLAALATRERAARKVERDHVSHLT